MFTLKSVFHVLEGHRRIVEDRSREEKHRLGLEMEKGHQGVHPPVFLVQITLIDTQTEVTGTTGSEQTDRAGEVNRFVVKRRVRTANESAAKGQLTQQIRIEIEIEISPVKNRSVRGSNEKTRAERPKFVDEIDQNDVCQGHVDRSSNRVELIVIRRRNVLIETRGDQFGHVDESSRDLVADLFVEFAHRLREVRNDRRPAIDRRKIEIQDETRQIQLDVTADDGERPEREDQQRSHLKST